MSIYISVLAKLDVKGVQRHLIYTLEALDGDCTRGEAIHISTFQNGRPLSGRCGG